MSPNLDGLSRREREIVNAVFAQGNRASGEEIRARLAAAPSVSSVRVMLTRLEKKGVLRHRRDGLKFIYSTTTAPAVAKRSALQHVIRTFFSGSPTQVISALVAEGSWSDVELDALTADIERARQARKKKP